MRAVCDPDNAGSSAVYLTNGTTKGSYFVHGQYFYGSGGGQAYTVDNGTKQPNLATGSGLIYYEQGEDANSSSEIVVKLGQLDADIIVARATETFTVHLYLNHSFGRCQVHAQVTPTS